MQETRSRAVRERVLDTALSIILEEGLEGLSMRKVGSQMGYTTGVVYYHFRDKQEILDALMDREGAVLQGTVQGALRPEASFRENLRSVYHAILSLVVKDAARYNMIVRLRHRHGEKDRPALLQMLTDMVLFGMASGELRQGDAEKVAFSVWSSFLGFHTVISQRTEITMAQADALFDAHFAMIMDGIGAEGS